MKVGLVWKVNVWKSSIFNVLIWTHRAIVTEIAWTTREIVKHSRNYNWISVDYFDSPWLENFTEELEFINKIIKQCDLLLFVVDFKRWITNDDLEIRDLIFKQWKKAKTLLLVNKMDKKVYGNKKDLFLADFYSLGFENILPCAAKAWEGMEDVREFIVNYGQDNEILKDRASQPITNNYIAILWRPNVWKSSLLNKIAWDQISKVEDFDGTTLDYIQADIEYRWQKYTLVDTAWIRRQWKVVGLEKIAFDKTSAMLDYYRPLIVLMFDAKQWLTHRDLSLSGNLWDYKLPMIIVINKADLVSKQELEALMKYIVAKLSFAKEIPIIPISAMTGSGIPDLFWFIKSIQEERVKKISTPELNRAIQSAWISNPPKFPKNKVCKCYYATQITQDPPKFKVFINKKDNLNFAFRRWIENVIRKEFGFIGVSISLDFEERATNSKSLNDSIGTEWAEDLLEKIREDR